ncbi:hypothetical protein [Okeania sp. SIO2B3]|nr:hypothetical protein [Okeania sp. SIO2B3]
MKTQENQQNIQGSTNNVLAACVKLKNRQDWIALTNFRCEITA